MSDGISFCFLKCDELKSEAVTLPSSKALVN